MIDVEMIDTREQTKVKSEQIINTILIHTEFFEARMHAKPTVFMSYDLFATIAAAYCDVLLYTFDKNQPSHTICGYDLEIIPQGSNLLYVGYKVIV